MARAAAGRVAGSGGHVIIYAPRTSFRSAHRRISRDGDTSPGRGKRSWTSGEEPQASPYGFYGFYGLTGNAGPFGPNRYCGNVTTVTRRVADGKRRVVARRPTLRCFAPRAAVATLYVEFSATPLPSALPPQP